MEEIPNNVTHIVGIDEVGRGPLAGPVTIGIFVKSIESQLPEGITDSKKLSPKKREEIFNNLKNNKYYSGYDFVTISYSAHDIDNIGISKCIKMAIKRGLNEIGCDPDCTLIYLDGGLKAPKEFHYQKTIIQGDAKIPVIGAASIVAKVTRDAYMVEQSKKFPKYFFDKHKGYATKVHRDSLKKHGMSPLHRVSFIHFL